MCVHVCVCVSFVAGSGNSIQITDKLYIKKIYIYCVLQPATACNQYSVFKELYDLSQDRLSAETRLSVLQQQHTQLDKVSA